MYDENITLSLRRACDYLVDDEYEAAFDWLARVVSDMSKYSKRPDVRDLTHTELFHLIWTACEGARGLYEHGN
jgi:hypothetical protein